MPSDPGQTIRFLRAVHRRHVLLRAAEHGAIGVVVGGCIGLVLLLAMLMTDGPLLSAWMMCVAACAGGLLGAAAGWIRRPTVLDSAMEADRQLDSTDLLSTAWTLRRKEDSWARQVIVCADVRCSQISPSAVLLARWGSRGWGSIGLVCVVLICASLLIQQTQVARAANRASIARGDASASSLMNEMPKSGTFEASPLSPPRAGSADTADSSIGQSEIESQSSSQSGQRADAGAHSGASDSHSDAAGTGMARTSSNRPTPLPEPSSLVAHDPGKRGQSLSVAAGDGATEEGKELGAAGSGHGPAAMQTAPEETRIARTNLSGETDRQGGYDQQAQPQYQPYSQLIREYFQRD